MSEPAHRNRNLPHFHLKGRARSNPYRPPPPNFRDIPKPRRPDDVAGHGARLQTEISAAIDASKKAALELGAGATTVAGGSYISVSGRDDFALEVKRLEKAGLLAIAHPSSDERDDQSREEDSRAVQDMVTVFVPDGKLPGVLKRLNEYASNPGKPRHETLINRIGAFRRATLKMLWTDSPSDFPKPGEQVWWEVWLRAPLSHIADGQFEAAAMAHQIQVGTERLRFPDRVVLLAKATPEQLERMMLESGDMAELRLARTNPQIFDEMLNQEQGEWARDLGERLQPAPRGAPAVCILDTGVNRGHPILSESLEQTDVHAARHAWGTHDHSGHGTMMAGLALFGETLPAFLESREPVELENRLESVKILPPSGSTEPHLFGAVTRDAITEIEAHIAHRSLRTFSMAVTNDEAGMPGEPTSWSAAVDALAAGRIIDPDGPDLRYDPESSPSPRRLFLISTGNVDTTETDHIAVSQSSPVQDPAQSWNSLAVGAFTAMSEARLGRSFGDGARVVARPGSLSPYSRTSAADAFSGWPIKPEIVMEGGNKVITPGSCHGFATPHLDLLTTARELSDSHFTTTRATSAAVAQAAHLAARIQARYPALWPETIRALLVHSARWTREMEEDLPRRPTKAQTDRFVRTFGFGVPDLERALHSAKDALTLVMEDEITPYKGEAYGDMNFYSLPWPTKELERLSGVTVKLRVTLSYFVEPYPIRKESERQRRYASTHLRFGLNRPLELLGVFLRRINAKEDKVEGEETAAEDSRWLLGPKRRHVGSLHHDVWTGPAGQLAKRNILAVTPVAGWMKDAPKKREGRDKLRYALIVSIETTDVEADLWTEVEQQIKIPDEVTVDRSSGKR